MSQPKKSLGQHWLFDEGALSAMVEAGEVTPTDTVLEVGPGLGGLTMHLASEASRVVAVEADSELASELKSRVPLDNLEVVEADILQYDTTVLSEDYKVVANIPYYLTSKILQYFLESNNRPSMMALLVQKEVAERVVAEPGQMSVLAFSVQYYAQARMLGVVAKELFDPEPKVDSAILQIKLRDKPIFNADTAKLFRLVKAGFGERRKKLINSLSGGLREEKVTISKLVERSGIDIRARAQELSMEEWGHLYSTALDMELL